MQLGLLYASGENGFEQNDEKAVYWFTKLAEEGACRAQLNLGVFYENGRGVEQSDEKAAYWYTKAAEQGSSEAQYNLGCFFMLGRGGLEKSVEKARLWWTKAAEQGDTNAKAKLDSLEEKQEAALHQTENPLWLVCCMLC